MDKKEFNHSFVGEIPPNVSIKNNAERGRDISVEYFSNVAEEKRKLWALYQFFTLVKTGGDMDYKKDGPYEDFGNYNYGVVAAAAGIDRKVAMVSAGAWQARNIFMEEGYVNTIENDNEKKKYLEYLPIVEKIKNSSTKEEFGDKLTEFFFNEGFRVGDKIGNYGYFDDPKDQKFIEQGYQDAIKNGYLNFNSSVINREDVQKAFRLNEIFKSIKGNMKNLFSLDNKDNIVIPYNDFMTFCDNQLNLLNKENIAMNVNFTQPFQGQTAITALVKENIPQKAQAEFLKQEDLKEDEKNMFGRIFENVSDKVKTLTEKKLDLNNLMQNATTNAMDAILNSEFIKVLLAMFGVKEERFKELFQGLFDKVGGFDQAMNNSFGFGMNASNAQQIDFSNYIWKGNTAGCRQFCDGEMSLNQRGYNRLLGMVQQGKMSQEMFNYCCNRNPIRQDMNEFYADMKAGLGEGVANIMMQMAKAESGLGKNIMNKEAAGAAGELQLIRSNAIAFGKKVWGAGHSDVEILKRYDEDPKFRNQVAIEFCKEQLKALRPPTAEGIRAVWFLGVGGGPKFLRAYHSNPNMSVANIFDEQVMKQNGMNASWTLRDCYNKFIATAGFDSSQRLDINISSQNYANNQHYNEEQSVGQKA